MNNYQKQKAKRQKAVFAGQAETGEDFGMAGKGGLPAEAGKVNIMEGPKFLKEWAKYDRDLKSIPALLGDILKETLATRILLEAKRWH